MASVGRLLYRIGSMVRETGQAVDRLGCRLQSNYVFQEELNRHRTLMNLEGKVPDIMENVFVAPSASIIGDVKVGGGSSIWYGAVLRGDVNEIRIGYGTNVQDNTLIHVARTSLSGKVLPTIVGDAVTIGHNAILHACTVDDEAFVGMAATLLDGVYVEKGAMVGAGSLVTQNTRIPSGEIWAGNPARFLRKLTPEEHEFILKSADNYSNLAIVHALENEKTPEEVHQHKVYRKRWSHQLEEDSDLGIIRQPPFQMPFGKTRESSLKPAS